MSWSRRTSWVQLMLALYLVGCGQSAHVRGLSQGGDTTRLQPVEGEPVLAGSVPEPAAGGGGELERQTEEEAGAARRAEVARALEAVIAVASSVERVGARQVWSYWVEGGALTPVGFRAEPGQGQPVRGIKDPQRLDQRMQTALGEYTKTRTGAVELALEREEADWRMNYRPVETRERPREARGVPVATTGMNSRMYLELHELAAQAVESLQVPAGGVARRMLEVELEDGRVVGWRTELYEVLRPGGAPQPVAYTMLGDVMWVLAALMEGVGPRRVTLEMRGVHRAGEAQARGWVAQAWVEQPPPPADMDEDFARLYRLRHEFVLQRWREKVQEDFEWVAREGGEELLVWWAGGVVARGGGILLELSLPAVRSALGKGAVAATGWLHTTLKRLPAGERKAFERLWAKVQLEGEKALTQAERETLRAVMQRMERIVRSPLNDLEKEKLRSAARAYYKKSYPTFVDIMNAAPERYPVHHCSPLEYAHLFPDEDVNALSNLALAHVNVHKRLNALWSYFRQVRPDPTPEEVRKMTELTNRHFRDWYERTDLPEELPPAVRAAEEAAIKELQKLFGNP